MKIRIETDEYRFNEAFTELEYYLPELASMYDKILHEMHNYNCLAWTFTDKKSIKIIPAQYKYVGETILKQVGYTFIFNI